MSKILNAAIAVVGIDIGKNSFHVVGHDERGAIVLHQKWSRGQVEARFANMRPCLIGMEACVGAHHLSRRLKALGHDARLMPAKYVRPYSKGQKNDFRDAETITEAVQRPTMWNEFLPISMPTVVIAALSIFDMACSLSLVPPPSMACWWGRSTAGPFHYRRLPRRNSALQQALT